MGAYAVPTEAGEARPFVRCNMITSLDGAISLNGRSGMLGGPPDTRVFQTLRALADVILVGAGTMRTERYGPARLDDDVRKQRLDRGQRPVPAIAVVTRSGNLDWSSPFFTDAEERPIIFTTDDSDETARVRAQKVADVVITGDAQADAGAMLGYLQETGRRSVLLEGGPALNAELVQAGLLDELCLTLSPRLVAGDGPRLLAGPELMEPLDLDVIHLLEEDGFLFYRLGVRQGQTR